MHTHFHMRSCSHGRQESFPLTSVSNSKSIYQKFAKTNLILFSKPGNSILYPVFNFYLSFPQHFIILSLFFLSQQGNPFISMFVRLTSLCHYQLTEMMEINNVQFIQINGCDDTELVAGANKRPLQANDDYCSGELWTISTDWKLAIKRFTICWRHLLIISLPKVNRGFWRQIVSHISFIWAPQEVVLPTQ